MNFHSNFVYFGCQHGAEATNKAALCDGDGAFRLAFSRPGFVTLKSELPMAPWARALPEGPFVRTRGHAHQKIEGQVAESMIGQVLDGYGALDWEYLHVWQRDTALPGWNDFEPGPNPLVNALVVLIVASLESRGDPRSQRINSITPLDAKVLDIAVVEPNLWWIGTRRVERTEDGWPGGVWPFQPPETMVSRAYLKLAEALAWGQIFFQPGDRVVEIGSAPGGACQRLLDLGCQVTGIDPAEMDPLILQHPNFIHWRQRSLQVKRRAFKDFRFLICDANVAPNYTLETVEHIVTYPGNDLEGLVLTIKLSDWTKAADVPSHLERVASWGFGTVMARQLAYNRREYCIVAKRSSTP